MTFFAISLYIPIRYAQTIKVMAPAAIDNPAPSKLRVFSRNGLMEASIVTIDNNTRFIRYFTSLDCESYETKSSPMHHWHEDIRPPQAPNHPFDVKIKGPLNVMKPVPNIHHSKRNTLHNFSDECSPTMGFSRNPGCKNSIVCRIRHIPKEMLATDIAYFIHGVGDHSAIQANRSTSEDTSTYKNEYDALSQREQP
mmetsp:Transcript_3184/g.5587  ORF Transcript_3184/g.5587 Transcript_3184/m.5587 type:complete len:196 (-) Transcript_3184:155-742(-)